MGKRPKFGDWFRNTSAGEQNPIRDGMYLRATRMKVNRFGATCKLWEMTNGKGKFWKIEPKYLIPLPREGASVDGLRQGNWAHPDGGRIVGWVVEPDDVERMKSDAFCLPREVAEALESLRNAHQATGEIKARGFALSWKGGGQTVITFDGQIESPPLLTPLRILRAAEFSAMQSELNELRAMSGSGSAGE